MRLSTMVKIGVLVGAVVLLAGCNMGGETIKDRIDTFLSDVNQQDWGGVKDSLDSSATSYNTVDASFWTTYFPEAQVPYQRTAFSTSGNTATVDITASGALGTRTFTFSMTEEDEGGIFGGTVYRIRRISVGGTTIFQ